MTGRLWMSGRKMCRIECLLMLGAMTVAILQYIWASKYVSIFDTGAVYERLVPDFSPELELIPQEYHIMKPATRTSASKGRYAYAFIVGSVHETQKSYRGFLFNVLCAVHVLREFGSEADFVAYLQPSPNSTLSNLPEQDIQWLKTLGIRIIALEKPVKASFADLMFDKFRILQLVEYKRVIYLDSDILPMNSLDYLFHLSDPDETSTPTLLRPNLIQASSGEPANGGMFMVQPYEGAWSQVQRVISRQREEGKQLPPPHFSRSAGWGHRFQDGDNWHAAKKNGTQWKFHGAHVDQGLLYYLMRFVLQDTSHIVGSKIENWGPDQNNPKAPRIVEAHNDKLWEYLQRHPPFWQNQYCFKRTAKYNSFECHPPYRDYVHFTGRRKPWQNPLDERWLQKNRVVKKGASQFWFRTLQKVNEQLSMGLDIAGWNEKYLPTMRQSPLGYMPSHTDNTNRIFGNTTG